MPRYVGKQEDLMCWFERTREDLDKFAAAQGVIFSDVIEVDRVCMIEGVVYINDDVPEGFEDVVSY